MAKDVFADLVVDEDGQTEGHRDQPPRPSAGGVRQGKIRNKLKQNGLIPYSFIQFLLKLSQLINFLFVI